MAAESNQIHHHGFAAPADPSLSAEKRNVDNVRAATALVVLTTRWTSPRLDGGGGVTPAHTAHIHRPAPATPVEARDRTAPGEEWYRSSDECRSSRSTVAAVGADHALALAVRLADCKYHGAMPVRTATASCIYHAVQTPTTTKMHLCVSTNSSLITHTSNAYRFGNQWNVWAREG